MTVGELIKVLAGYEDDRLVVVARDPEGNGYSPLWDTCEADYRPHDTYSGELLDEDDTAIDGDRTCVVLWPTN